MQNKSVTIPDMGGVEAVTIVEVHVKEGDRVEKETPLATCETEKASMEIPSPFAGTIAAILIKGGDEVSEGSEIMTVRLDMQSNEGAQEDQEDESVTKSAEENKALEWSNESGGVCFVPKKKDLGVPEDLGAVIESDGMASQTTLPQGVLTDEVAPKASLETEVVSSGGEKVYAGPSVRRLASALEIDLAEVRGSGPKGRILREDLHALIAQKMQKGSGAGNVGVQSVWEDPSRFGEVSAVPLTKIKRITARRLSASWASTPQVTQFDKADITELEALRGRLKQRFLEKGHRLTMLAFVVKALAQTLQAFPTFNAAYEMEREMLHLRSYVHIGVAVDTPNGLVVPVIQHADTLSIEEISGALKALSEKARNGKLTPMEMRGASMSVSSLGGIGGEYFTPLVNPPQVAILGVSQARREPVWNDEAHEVRPCLRLPLSMSYDHRVIDGAETMRFLNALIARLTVDNFVAV